MASPLIYIFYSDLPFSDYSQNYRQVILDMIPVTMHDYSVRVT